MDTPKIKAAKAKQILIDVKTEIINGQKTLVKVFAPVKPNIKYIVR